MLHCVDVVQINIHMLQPHRSPAFPICQVGVALRLAIVVEAGRGLVASG